MARDKKVGLPLADLSLDELRQELEKTQRNLFQLRLQGRSGTLKNHRQIRHTRRHLARVLTFLNQHERA